MKKRSLLGDTMKLKKFGILKQAKLQTSGKPTKRVRLK